MQNAQDQNPVTPNLPPRSYPQRFDNQDKPGKEQETEQEASTEQHDHGKSHSGL